MFRFVCFVVFVFRFVSYLARPGWVEGRARGWSHGVVPTPWLQRRPLNFIRAVGWSARQVSIRAIHISTNSVTRKIPMRDGNEINKGRWSPRRDVWYLGRDSTRRDKVLRCTIRVETPRGRFLPRVALVRVRNESSWQRRSVVVGGSTRKMDAPRVRWYVVEDVRQDNQKFIRMWLFKLQSQIVKQTRFIESQDFASCGRTVVRTFLFVSGVGVALKNFHYRIGDPTLLSGGWLGVRQVTFAIFFFVYTGSARRWRANGRVVNIWGATSESLRFCVFHLCPVVAFRKPEKFLVRKGRTLRFRTSCR
jgi:hypothetical protein